jgi:small subunit ribosomal protein S15
MALSREQKQAIVARHRLHGLDSGSPEVQIALLTERIRQLGEHFTKHSADYHSRRGLLRIVERRRGLLNRLEQRKHDSYKSLIKDLGLRR